MTQEDKELLIRDLCARLPYGVEIQVKEWATLDTELKIGHINRLQNDDIELKPYLRPLSSMTEKEFTKLKEYSGLIYDQLDLASYQNSTYKCLDFYLSEVPSYVVILVFDWLNAHHFDYRGLIERGLAIKAPADLELENENKNPKITVGTKIRLKTNPNVILSIISTDCHEDEFECSNGSVLSLKQIEKYYDIYIDENNGKQI